MGTHNTAIFLIKSIGQVRNGPMRGMEVAMFTKYRKKNLYSIKLWKIISVLQIFHRLPSQSKSEKRFCTVVMGLKMEKKDLLKTWLHTGDMTLCKAM